MIDQTTNFQQRLNQNESKIGVTLGEISFMIDNCLRNRLTEQKSDQKNPEDFEMIDTSSIVPQQ